MDVGSTTLSALTTTRTDAQPQRPREQDQQQVQAVQPADESEKPRGDGPRGKNLDIKV